MPRTVVSRIGFAYAVYQAGCAEVLRDMLYLVDLVARKRGIGSHEEVATRGRCSYTRGIGEFAYWPP